jgi:hypothetical protein
MSQARNVAPRGGARDFCVSAQAKQPTGVVDWLRVDASSPVESIVSRVLPAILG